MSEFVKPPLPEPAEKQVFWDGAPLPQTHRFTAAQLQARDAELLRAVADWLVEVQTERQHGEWDALPAEVIDELRKAAEQ